jgi:hypothetical protein
MERHSVHEMVERLNGDTLSTDEIPLLHAIVALGGRFVRAVDETNQAAGEKLLQR